MREITHYPVFNQQANARTELIIISPPPVNEHQFQRLASGHYQRRAGTTSQYAKAAAEFADASGVHLLDLWTVIMRKVGWTPSMGRDCCCDHLPYPGDPPTLTEKEEVQHIPGCHHLSQTLPNADYELSEFLADGLHLTKLGYDVLFWELLRLIKTQIPRCAPESLPFILPEWKAALSWP